MFIITQIIMPFTNANIKNRLIRFILLSGILLAGSVQQVFAADPVNTTFFGNTAIKGYDPVAYFVENAPVKGDKQYTFEWQGANWQFASQANLDTFKSDPVAYAPQYGGYCAWAVANNKLAPIDPSQFAIYEGKLYLNYNASIAEKWLADKDDFITQADANWPDVLN